MHLKHLPAQRGFEHGKGHYPVTAAPEHCQWWQQKLEQSSGTAVTS